jgi:hypothetical protein
MDQYSTDGTSFTGAVGVDVGTNTLTEAGRTTHADDVDEQSYWPGVSRAFVASGVLYTVSEGGVEANDLDDLSELDFLRF